MSWGGSEFAGETGGNYDGIFSAAYPQGVTFVASSGDSGAGVEYPAASPYVVGVGGTTLTQSSGLASGLKRLGPAAVVALAPSSRSQVGRLGWNPYSPAARGVPDVAYVANPNSGVYVYCSSYQRGSTWWEVGGTSAGAPQWAALIALSGYRPTSGTGANPELYSLAGTTAPIADADYSLIASGNNGSDSDDSRLMRMGLTAW